MYLILTFPGCNSILESNRRGQTVQLTLEVPVLRDLVEELANKVLGVLEDLDGLAEVLRLLRTVGSDDTVPFCDAAAAGVGDLETGHDGEGFLDEVDSLAGSTESLQVAKGFADPVPDLAVLGQGLDVRTTGDEGRIEHGRAHTVIEVVWGNTLAS